MKIKEKNLYNIWIKKIERINGQNLTNLYLWELEIKDLEEYLYWDLTSREFRKYNGPYYAQSTAV